MAVKRLKQRSGSLNVSDFTRRTESFPAVSGTVKQIDLQSGLKAVAH